MQTNFKARAVGQEENATAWAGVARERKRTAQPIISRIRNGTYHVSSMGFDEHSNDST